MGDIIQTLAKPQVIGPMIGMFAVIGWAINKGLNAYFSHQEKMEKIRSGIDPDYELND